MRTVTELARDQDLDSDLLSKKEAFSVQQMWLQSFASEMHDATGKWVQRGHMWNCFSLGYHPALRGYEAISEYENQSANGVYIFDEGFAECVLAHGMPRGLHRLSILADLYITNLSADWTIAFTHELGIGPFFATCTRSL